MKKISNPKNTSRINTELVGIDDGPHIIGYLIELEQDKKGRYRITYDKPLVI
ncbi:hypothetical protein K9M79_05625 [Candidatus Woesearchaeota archaeon]|nr:hypothetical protein [Candidatus Woesearchaeota archaeon]